MSSRVTFRSRSLIPEKDQGQSFMNLSAILIVTTPAGVKTCIAMLDSLPGVSVHHSDPASGRIMAVQEAETTAAEVEGLKCIKALDGIVMAEMIYHYFEEDAQLEVEMPADLDAFEGLAELPRFRDPSAK